MTSIAYSSQEMSFYQQYEMARRDEVVGVLLALFLGGFGVHHFYLRRTGLGILYCFLCWTPIPWFLGFIECFFMPGRVREFNAIQAASISAATGVPLSSIRFPFSSAVNGPATSYAQPGLLFACGRCQRANPSGARFCSSCGSAL